MPELDEETRQRNRQRMDRLDEIRRSMPRYVQLSCRLCGWAVNGLDLNEARKGLEEHEKSHPEYAEWRELVGSREDTAAAIHDHECQITGCTCRCGCQSGPFCSLVFGTLCSVCTIREMRGDHEHGRRQE